MADRFSSHRLWSPLKYDLIPDIRDLLTLSAALACGEYKAVYIWFIPKDVKKAFKSLDRNWLPLSLTMYSGTPYMWKICFCRKSFMAAELNFFSGQSQWNFVRWSRTMIFQYMKPYLARRNVASRAVVFLPCLHGRQLECHEQLKWLYFLISEEPITSKLPALGFHLQCNVAFYNIRICRQFPRPEIWTDLEKFFLKGLYSPHLGMRGN